MLAPLGNFGALLYPFGCLALLSVPGILFYQARQWLITGRWPPITVANGLHWAGLTLPHSAFGLPLTDKQFLDFPLSLALLAVIGLPLFAYARFSQWVEDASEPEATRL
jgi:hypothetical protein